MKTGDRYRLNGYFAEVVAVNGKTIMVDVMGQGGRMSRQPWNKDEFKRKAQRFTDEQHHKAL